MKARRIVAAVLATVMAVGTGTVAASAKVYEVKAKGAAFNYIEGPEYDTFEFRERSSTTLSYESGYRPNIVAWDVDVTQSGKSVEIEISGNDRGTWAPQYKKLYAYASVISTNGNIHSSGAKYNGYNTFAKANTSAGWSEEFSSGWVETKYETANFYVIGSTHRVFK